LARKLTDIIRVVPDEGADWAACTRIYNAAFPEWEREPLEHLVRRLVKGRYRMWAGLVDADVAGFSIVDFDFDYRYALVSYLAVDEGMRGHGFGTHLCRDTISRFQSVGDCDWLVVEAEDRQARFYGSLGFRWIDVTYQVPRYDGGGTVPMNLMALPADGARQIARDDLRSIVRRMFLTGYDLNISDDRLTWQLDTIDRDADLLAAPRPSHNPL